MSKIRQALQLLAAEGRYTPPPRCEIHVGADEWQSVPAQVLASS
jgi:hypothetical protein